MTREEREKPDLLAKSASRRRRIAKGSGRSERQVNELLTTFTQMRVQMKAMSKMMAATGGLGAFRFTVTRSAD
jgi:signal recognition particle subunit SRP54